MAVPVKADSCHSLRGCRAAVEWVRRGSPLAREGCNPPKAGAAYTARAGEKYSTTGPGAAQLIAGAEEMYSSTRRGAANTAGTGTAFLTAGAGEKNSTIGAGAA